MKEKEKVEPLPAMLWICPECGEDNFERMIIQEMSEEEENEILEELDDPDMISAENYLYPLDVRCKNCNEEFGVEEFKCDECRDKECEDDDE